MEEKANEKKFELFRLGVVVFAILAVLTIGEYFIGIIAVGWTWPLWGIALLKATLIVRDYMHLPRLFSQGEEDHS
jgi:hypothetical protein